MSSQGMSLPVQMGEKNKVIKIYLGLLPLFVKQDHVFDVVLVHMWVLSGYSGFPPVLLTVRLTD